ncbi:hypothetical protein [Enterococcus italicus]
MIKTTIVGFPRIGEFRELKFATEAFFRGADCKIKLDK